MYGAQGSIVVFHRFVKPILCILTEFYVKGGENSQLSFVYFSVY